MRSPIYTKAVKEKRDILRELYGGMMTVADLTIELGYKDRKSTKEWITQVALPGTMVGSRIRYDTDLVARTLVDARGI